MERTRNLAKQLSDVNRVLSVPITAIMISLLVSNFTAINYYFQPLSTINKLFCLLFQVYIIAIIYMPSTASQRCLDHFDHFHWCLLDRAVETVHNRYSRHQKHQPA